jgi:cytochrome c-type biogenesis protein CcmH/NrfG
MRGERDARRSSRVRSRTASARSNIVRKWIYAAAVGAVTIAALVPILGNGFVNYDDDRALIHNPYIVEEAPGRFAWMWSTVHLGHYQPIAWLSLAFDYAIAGLSAFAFHLDSLLWHAAAAVLLYLLLLKLLARARGMSTAQLLTANESSRAFAAAGAGALFWAIHPLRVESVAWVTERRDPISLVFLLFATIAYLRSVAPADSSVRVQSGWYATSVACLLLSLLAKGWGMTFFVVLLALDVFPLRRLPFSLTAMTDGRYRPVWLQKIPFAVLGAAAAAVAWIAQRSQPDAMVTLSEWTLWSRVLQTAYGLCFYVWKTIWPARLAVLYGLPSDVRSVESLWTLCLVIVVGMAIVLLTAGRRWPVVTICFVSYAAMLSPVLGLVQSGPQLVADRYSYVSAVPFSALIAAGLMSMPGRRFRGAVGALVVWLAILGVVTWRQAGVWRNSITLWSHAIETGHESYIAHLDYGQALRADGQMDRAIAEYRQAIRVRPASGNAWYNLANSLKAAGDIDGAESAYKMAIQHLPRKLEAQVNLGNLYYQQRRLPEAIAEYRAATSSVADLPPELVAPEPFLYLGMALADNGDADAARQALQVALRYNSTHARAQQELQRIESR